MNRVLQIALRPVTPNPSYTLASPGELLKIIQVAGPQEGPVTIRMFETRASVFCKSSPDASTVWPGVRSLV